MHQEQHGYTTPPHFEQQLKIQLRQTITGKSGFVVPDGYETKLKHNLLAIAQPDRKNKLVLKWRVAAAVALLLTASASWWLMPQPTQQVTTIDYTSAGLQELSVYELLDNPQLFEPILNELPNTNTYDDYILFES